MASSLLAAIDTSLKHLSFYLASTYIRFGRTLTLVIGFVGAAAGHRPNALGCADLALVSVGCVRISSSHTHKFIYIFFHFLSFFRSPLCNGNNPHEKLPAKNIYESNTKGSQRPNKLMVWDIKYTQVTNY